MSDRTARQPTTLWLVGCVDGTEQHLVAGDLQAHPDLRSTPWSNGGWAIYRITGDEIASRIAPGADGAAARGSWSGLVACVETLDEVPNRIKRYEEARRISRSSNPYAVGCRVEGGDIVDDYDAGHVIETDGDLVIVAWDSGGYTTQHHSLVRPEGMEED